MPAPSMEILNPAECLELFSGVPVGRIAITVSTLPVILPVNFVVIDGNIFFRTERGTRLPQPRQEPLSHSRSTRTSPTGAQVGA
jgi:nitroimidazol reductase NimA-like FMN-containing flavoprotein (pyridoxamine 5'-phosphate oxidase superfamily)